MGCGLWVAGYGLWVVGCGLWVVGLGFWVLGVGFWLKIFGLWGFEVTVGGRMTFQDEQAAALRSRCASLQVGVWRDVACDYM